MPGVGTTHHVLLDGHYYIVRPGSYQKRAAPTFGARFVTGDPDFNNLSMWQHWAQKCFVGGMGQEEFADDAMFDESVGLDTTNHELVRLSRDLTRGAGANWTISSGTANASSGYKAVIYNSILYVVTIPTLGTAGHLWKYDTGTDGWVRITSLDSASISIRSVAAFDGKLFIGGYATAGGYKLVYSSGALTAWTTQANPAGVGQGVYAMRAFQRKLYVAYGTQVWRMKEDQTWDGNTVFYKADQNSESNYVVSFEVHLGFLYFLSQNGHIHRTDGNSTFDIWSWDGQTQGLAIKSFDGRLFVLTFEYTTTTSAGFGVLYQMSGSAVTQLKRWGDPGLATQIGNMVVYDRKLWFGASNLLGTTTTRQGFGVGVYDPVEDAYSIYAANSDQVAYPPGTVPYPNYIVDDQIFFQGRLYCFTRGFGVVKTTYETRDVTKGSARFDISNSGVSIAPGNGGWLTTSTYDAGLPGVRKLWRKVGIDCSIAANTSIVGEYSIDGGATWTVLPVISTVVARYRFEFWLNNVISTSIKLRLTLRSTDGTKTPVLYGFVVSYVPVPEPNWLWTFTIVLSEKQQLLDGTIATVDTEAEIAFLNTLFRNKQLVSFTDAEGVVWAAGGQPGVLPYDIAFNLRDLNQPLEGEVTVTLLEAVETY